MKLPGRNARLTPNQVALLRDLAEGFTVAEIASEWGTSQTVIYRTIERARLKLGARTTPQACAIWAAMGLARAGAPSASNGQTDSPSSPVNK